MLNSFVFVSIKEYVCIIFSILVNTSDEPLLKKTKRDSDIVHVIAPGQRQEGNDR